ncbi:hypothetical protein ACFFQF_23590 [Haladaptatus pallidirubidus]|uniref:DUF7344 domain-containing protein n=1 Tax=Haladaptatus pallidirubidus TaxID=1008152 RepID=A0AAV3UNE0_9EURY|nr:hypothetical protein [Haladaptatus pallidirubidus]
MKYSRYWTPLQAVRQEHRRQVLSYLETKDSDVAELDELAEQLYEEVDGITSPGKAQLTLSHTHVLKLAEHDVIEYDLRSETVRYRDGSHVEAMLAVVAAQWRRSHGGLEPVGSEATHQLYYPWVI